MDYIRIIDLEVFANHGVLKEENLLGQKFLISAEIGTDTSLAGSTDNIEHSVNYADVCNDIVLYTTENTFKLIERLAEGLAEKILIKYQLAQTVKITVKKPFAPIMKSLDTVSVEIKRRWNDVILSLGSNIGDRECYLNYAIDKFRNDKKCRVDKISPFIETKPYGNVAQDDFLNACIRIFTLYTPSQLLKFAMNTEAECKRERKIHWGPRTLDIDIILYNSDIIEEENLIIPHIEMTKRTFVMEPLCGIAPYRRHPVSGLTMTEIYSSLTAASIEKR